MFAYACEPDRGSEPGAGWGLVQAVGQFAECTVLVAPEHTPGIERYRGQHSSDRYHYVEVTEPWWSRFAKWHRIPRFVAYLVWLRRARKEATVLHTERAFDVAYHATFSVFWLPSPVHQLGIPSVWGPVGGAVRTPVRLWRLLGWTGVLGELLDLVAVRVASWVPATRRTWREATVPLVQNDETLRRLPSHSRVRSISLNHAMFTPAPGTTSSPPADFLLWAARLEARKGPRLAVMALARSSEDVRLVMVGDGPEQAAVERLARRLGVDHRLELRGRVAHDEVLQLMSRAVGLVSTGLREEGGIALAEAMMMGRPVIVLAHGGARTLAESTIDPNRVALIRPETALATAERMGQAMTRFVREPDPGSGPLLDQDAARGLLVGAFSTAVGYPVEN